MKKTLIVMLALAIALGLGCACAEPGAAADLAGSWTAEYEGVPMLCLIEEDNTFEAVLLESLPIEEMTYAGTWEFDGATLTLKSDGRIAAFAWDGATLTGELFDLPVVLARPTFEDAGEAAARAAGTSRPLDQYDEVGSPDELDDVESTYLN